MTYGGSIRGVLGTSRFRPESAAGSGTWRRNPRGARPPLDLERRRRDPAGLARSGLAGPWDSPRRAIDLCETGLVHRTGAAAGWARPDAIASSSIASPPVALRANEGTHPSRRCTVTNHRPFECGKCHGMLSGDARANPLPCRCRLLGFSRAGFEALPLDRLLRLQSGQRGPDRVRVGTNSPEAGSRKNPVMATTDFERQYGLRTEPVVSRYSAPLFELLIWKATQPTPVKTAASHGRQRSSDDFRRQQVHCLSQRTRN